MFYKEDQKPQKTTLSIRKTHTYVGTYADLDDWADVGEIEVLSRGTEQKNEEDICDSTEIYLIVRVSLNRELRDEDIRRALISTLSRAGCAHEYDCCGCVSIHVRDARQIPSGETNSDNLWFIHQHSSRNY